MNSLGLRQAIDDFLIELDKNTVFLSHLLELSSHFDGVNGFISNIAKGNTDIRNDAAAKTVIHFNLLGSIVLKISHRQFFKQLEAFHEAVENIKERWGCKDIGIFVNIIYRLNEFSSVYDEYLGKRDAQSAYLLLLNASKLNMMVNIFIETLQSVRDAIYSNDLIPDGGGDISLILPEHYGLKDFAERLLAIQSIYTELCLLFGISENEYPLSIGKVESGSLYAKLFGKKTVMEIMAAVVEKSAVWAYSNFTPDGKINGLPRKVEAIDAVLNLSQRLEAAGFDTDEMRPNIEKAAIALSKNLATLIDGQPSITVNDEKLSLHQELTKTLLERRDVRLLERNPEQKPDEGPAALPE